MMFPIMRLYAYMKSKIKKRIEVRAWIGWSKGKSLRSRNDLQIDLDFSNSTLKHFEHFLP